MQRKLVVSHDVRSGAACSRSTVVLHNCGGACKTGKEITEIRCSAAFQRPCLFEATTPNNVQSTVGLHMYHSEARALEGTREVMSTHPIRG